MNRFTYDEQSRIKTLTWQSIPVGVDVDLPIWISTFEYGENRITLTKTSSLEFDPDYVPETKVTKYEIIGNKVYTNGADPIEIDSKGRAINHNRVYDENGNVVSYNYYGQLELTPEYDKANGIFRHVNMPSWFLTDGLKVVADPELFLYNNAVVAWHTATLGSAQPAGYGFKMEYNDYDYPVRVSRYLINIISNGYSYFKVDYTKK